MASIPKLRHDHVTLEIECLDRLYLNGYIGRLATSGGWVTFMQQPLGKPIPSPVVLGQETEKFRAAIKAQADELALYQSLGELLSQNSRAGFTEEAKKIADL